MRFIVSVLCIVQAPLVFAQASAGQELQSNVPDMPSARVEVSWADVKSLIEAGAVSRQPEKPRPPVPAAVSSAVYAVEALSNTTVRVEAQFDIMVWEEVGWATVPVISGGIGIVSATLDGESAALVRGDTGGMLSLVLDEPGRHTADIAFFARSEVSEGMAMLSFQTAPTTVTSMHLRVPVPDAKVASPNAASTVARETGHIGVTARGPVEIAPAPELEGLTRIDESELPDAVRAMSPSPILFAFRYNAPGLLLAVDVRRLEDVPVRVANIDRATLTTALTREGMAVTRAVYDVRNNIKQFLRIELDDNAELWSAEVAGQPVKPARETDSSTLLLPLRKSVESDRLLGAFPVSITYMERTAALGGLTQTLNLRAPATDILVSDVEWNVVLPNGRVIYSASGDLQRAESTRVAGTQLRTALQRYDGLNQEQILPLKEGIERFLITDINNPAGSVGSMANRYQGSPREASPTDSAVAGVLPVRVGLPTDGAPHHFKRLLVP